MKKAWWERLKRAEREYVLSYEDLRDVYQYLRSTRELIGNIDKEIWGEIVIRIVNVFQTKEFGKTEKLKEIINALEHAEMGPNETYRNKKIRLDVKYKKRKEFRVERQAKEYLKNGSRMTRAKNWQYRVEVAIEKAVKHGWYPMFGTYTVDPKRLPEGCLSRDDLWQKTDAWDKFVKKFKTEIAEACGYGRRPANWPIGATFLKYWAVIEHGKSTEHPHIHIIWLAKKIPTSWRWDPNTNCPGNLEVDIAPASALWSHGIQRRTQAIFINGSWFTTYWKLPRKSEEEPGEVGTAAAVAGYISKYMTKDGGSNKWKNGTYHRVKATKSLGLDKLIDNLKKVTSAGLLLTLASRPATYDLSLMMQTMTAVPLSLLREKSRQELYRRLHSSKSTLAKKYLSRAWTKRPGKYFTFYMLSVRDGLKPWRMMPQQRFKLNTLMLEVPKSTAHCKKRVKAAIDWLCYNEAKNQTSDPYVLLRGT